MGKSHQRGWVVARGKKWYGYYRRTVLDPVTNAPVTDVVTIVLGLKARLTKSEAREELQTLFEDPQVVDAWLQKMPLKSK